MEATLERALSLFRKSAARPRTKTPRCGARQGCARVNWPLNLPLVRFSERSEDIWTLSDAFQGVSIMGENGERQKRAAQANTWRGNSSKTDLAA